MYGLTYKKADLILNIYVFTCLPLFLGAAQGLWMLNHRRSHLYLLQTICGAVASVLANFLLIPIWGLHGAAASAVISQVISSLLVNSIFARDLFLMQLGIRLRT